MKTYKITITTNSGELVTVFIKAMNWFEAVCQIRWILEHGTATLTVDGPYSNNSFM